jgi:hypothetical protein
VVHLVLAHMAILPANRLWRITASPHARQAPVALLADDFSTDALQNAASGEPKTTPACGSRECLLVTGRRGLISAGRSL